MSVLRLSYLVTFLAFFLTSYPKNFLSSFTFPQAIASTEISANQQKLKENSAPQSIDALIKLLSDKDASVRLKAARKLASFADQSLEHVVFNRVHIKQP